MHDATRLHGLSEEGERFVAGIQRQLLAMTAVTAPSFASHFRLRPGRWTPTWNNIGYRDRGAALRICPGLTTSEALSRQFNVEHRVVDATASPYMRLGALIHAGTDGIRQKLALAPSLAEGFWNMTHNELERADFRQLPQSLEDALAQLSSSEAATAWFGDEYFRVYLQFKPAECRAVGNLSEEAIIAQYADAY
jgi:glutamine synthetase